MHVEADLPVVGTVSRRFSGSSPAPRPASVVIMVLGSATLVGLGGT